MSTTTRTAPWGQNSADPRLSTSPTRRKPVIENAILGTLVFIVTEVMFFTALISAYMVIRAGSGVFWVPPESARLPVFTTAFNTVVLLASGVLIWFAGRSFGKPQQTKLAEQLYLVAIALGSFFVCLQGYEWVQLIRVGMTMTSGVFGATFFLVIGMHAAHAFTAILAMIWVYRRMQRGTLTVAGFTAMRIFWYFVVGVWPILYGLVYFP